MSRLDVRKTYKLYVGGKFPRSESGRSYEVVDAKGRFVANAARASRKDARDAVVAARAAVAGWSGAHGLQPGPGALPRGRDAGGPARRSSWPRSARPRGSRHVPRRGAVDAAIDRWVWYAGWSDKFTQVDGAANPVAGPVLQLLGPRADRRGRRDRARSTSSLLGLVSVVGAGHRRAATPAWWWRPRAVRCPAVTLGEVLATSDVPGGVVNLLTGQVGGAGARRWPRTCDVNAIDLTGVGDAELAATSRSRRPRTSSGCCPHRAAEPDWDGDARPAADPGLHRGEDGLAPDGRVSQRR